MENVNSPYSPTGAVEQPRSVTYVPELPPFTVSGQLKKTLGQQALATPQGHANPEVPATPTEPQEPGGAEPTAQSSEQQEIEAAQKRQAFMTEILIEQMDHSHRVTGIRKEREIRRTVGSRGNVWQTDFETLTQMGVMDFERGDARQNVPDTFIVKPDAIRKAVKSGELPAAIGSMLEERLGALAASEEAEQPEESVPAPEKAQTEPVERPQPTPPATEEPRPAPRPTPPATEEPRPAPRPTPVLEPFQQVPAPTPASGKPYISRISRRVQKMVDEEERGPIRRGARRSNPQASEANNQGAASPSRPVERTHRAETRPNNPSQLPKEETEDTPGEYRKPVPRLNHPDQLPKEEVAARYTKSVMLSETAGDYILAPEEVDLLKHEEFLAFALTTSTLEQQFASSKEFSDALRRATGLDKRALGTIIGFLSQNGWIEGYDDKAYGLRLTEHGKQSLRDGIAAARQ